MCVGRSWRAPKTVDQTERIFPPTRQVNPTQTVNYRLSSGNLFNRQLRVLGGAELYVQHPSCEAKRAPPLRKWTTRTIPNGRLWHPFDPNRKGVHSNSSSIELSIETQRPAEDSIPVPRITYSLSDGKQGRRWPRGLSTHRRTTPVCASTGVTGTTAAVTDAILRLGSTL